MRPRVRLKNRLFRYSALLLGVLEIAAASEVVGSEHGPIVIGMLLPPEQAEAKSLREGVQLAVEQANSAGNRSVQLIVRGRTGQWGADGVEAARMATDDGVMGLIAAPDGSATHLALQVSGRTAVPVISLCPDSSVTKTGVPWMVRVVPGTIEEVQALLKGLRPQLGHASNSVFALVPEGRAGREAARDLREGCRGPTFALQNLWEVNATNLSSESKIPELLKRQPELVLVWLEPIPAGAIVKQLRTRGFKGLLAGPVRLRCDDFMNAAGRALEGFVVTDVLLDQHGARAFAAFEKAFRSRFGHDPGATAAFSYDAANLLLYIFQTSNGEAHRAFPLNSSIAGATGSLKFDREGNRKAELRLLVAHQGKFSPLEQQ